MKKGLFLIFAAALTVAACKSKPAATAETDATATCADSCKKEGKSCCSDTLKMEGDSVCCDSVKVAE